MFLTGAGLLVDFTEHRWLRDWPSDGAALTDAVAALQARGAIWLRARFRATHILVEGWIERPTARGASAAVKPRAGPGTLSR